MIFFSRELLKLEQGSQWTNIESLLLDRGSLLTSRGKTASKTMTTTWNSPNYEDPLRNLEFSKLCWLPPPRDSHLSSKKPFEMVCWFPCQGRLELRPLEYIKANVVNACCWCCCFFCCCCCCCCCYRWWCCGCCWRCFLLLLLLMPLLMMHIINMHRN